jgi:hypothetical protein
MVKAKVKNYYVQYSDFNLSNGAKGGSRKYYSDGRFHKIRNGWDYEYKPLKMIVECELDDGEIVETWVDRYFKNELGRLTTRRKEAIEDNLPKYVTLEEQEGLTSTYYTICEEDLREWLHRAKTQLGIA